MYLNLKKNNTIRTKRRKTIIVLLQLSLFLLLLLLSPPQSSILLLFVKSELITYDFTVTSEYRYPDGRKRAMLLVNNQFPGPEIRVKQDDTLQIHVTNNISTIDEKANVLCSKGEHDCGFTLHMHGLHQHSTPYMDGAYMYSQCNIAPVSLGLDSDVDLDLDLDSEENSISSSSSSSNNNKNSNTFTYVFNVGKQVGTYWWHSHSKMLIADGLYGPFIIEDSDNNNNNNNNNNNMKIKDLYDEERNIMIADHYHQTSNDQEEGLDRQHNEFKWIGDPQTILFNGKGNVTDDCSSLLYHHHHNNQDIQDPQEDDEGNNNIREMIECSSNAMDYQGLDIIHVKPNQRYRFRIWNTGSLSYLDYAIEDHNMTIIEVDGIYIEPVIVSHLPINIGQRYSVIIETKTKEELKALLYNNNNNNTEDFYEKSNTIQQNQFWMSAETKFRNKVTGYSVLHYDLEEEEEEEEEEEGNGVVNHQQAEQEMTEINLHFNGDTSNNKNNNNNSMMNINNIDHNRISNLENYRHAGEWNQEILRLMNQMNTMKANVSLSMEDWDPIRDEYTKLMTRESIAFSSKLRVKEDINSQYYQYLYPPPANKFLKIVVTQCVYDVRNNTLYTPYNESNESYDNIHLPLGVEDVGQLKWCMNQRPDHTETRTKGVPILYKAYQENVNNNNNNNNNNNDNKISSLDVDLLPKETNLKENVIVLEKGDVVDIVIQNAEALNSVGEQHPMHLHGHNFWVLEQSMGQHRMDSWSNMNFNNPVVRDTVTLYPFGYTVIRFVADNPGIWPLHCHIASHQAMGQAITIIERQKEIPLPPKEYIPNENCKLNSLSSSSNSNHNHNNNNNNNQTNLRRV